MAYWVGITGGIGSGKSVVSHLLRVMGYPVYDSDSMASRLMDSDQEVVTALKRLLGDEAYREDNTLHKEYVAQKIFSDPTTLARVNSIIHPAVVKDMFLWAEQQCLDILFVESAILLTSVLKDHVDCVVSVIANKATRIERIQKRSGLTISQIEDRMNNQLSDRDVIALSDYVICNDQESLLIEQTVTLVNALIQNTSIKK